MEKERSEQPPMSLEEFTAQVNALRNRSKDGHSVRNQPSASGQPPKD